jgi:hypothetical protein
MYIWKNLHIDDLTEIYIHKLYKSQKLTFVLVRPEYMYIYCTAFVPLVASMRTMQQF